MKRVINSDAVGRIIIAQIRYFSQIISHMKIFGIPGTSFSPRRALGVDVLKRSIAKATGIPTTKQGLERKIGRTVIKGVTKLLK